MESRSNVTPLRSTNEGASVLGPTWAYEVLPSGMPHSGPDMSTRDMRLGAASDEAADSVGTGSLAEDLCSPLGCCRLATPATTVAYATLPSVGLNCRLFWAACSPVGPWASGPLSNGCSGAGRRLAGSDAQSDPDSSTPFLLGALSSRGSREERASPTQLGHSKAYALTAVALWAARVFFFPAATDFLSSRRNSGETSTLLIALIKANSSCLSIAPQQELTFLFLPLFSTQKS